MNRSKIFIAVTALIMIGIGASIWQTIASSGDGTLDLSVSPVDASVKVDGSALKTKPGKLSLAPGEHSLEISHEGYTTQQVKVTVVAGITETQGVILEASAETAAKNAAKLSAKQKAEAEGVAGAIVAEQGKKITAANPLLKQLPYYGLDFKVDAGVSKAHPDDPSAVAIYITANGSQTMRTHALDWIKSQGFDPAAYEIIYLEED